MNARSEVLNKAIREESQKQSNCSWCFPGGGDEKTSHTICTRHAEEFVAQIAKQQQERTSRAARESGMPCGECNSCKSNSRYGCIHTARRNDQFAVFA